MQWEATDQFGNLYVGISQSTDSTSLVKELRSMLEEVWLRGAHQPVVTIDLGYGEICSPDPDNVSHILQVPWLCNLSADEARRQIEAIVQQIAAESGHPEPTLEVR